MKAATPAVKTRARVVAAASKNTGAKVAGAMKMVKPVVNAMQILRYLSQATEPARAVDIARHLAINQSTCFNILRTLVAEEMVDFDALSKTYTAGIGLANLVGQFVTQGQRIEVAKPLMRELAGRFAVTVTLWRPIGVDRIVLVSSEVSPTDLRIDMAEGQRLPYLMGASGRVFAGSLAISEAELHEAFDKLRWSEALTFATYLREVHDAKKRGYAIDDGNFARGIMAIAAPVHDKSGAIAFAVSAVMFRNEFDKAGIAKLGNALHELGATLSDVLF
jgi:DNA-binding IclR family transcriptional regulator